MSTYRIEVHPYNFSHYVEVSSGDLLSLLGKLEACKTASHNGGPVFLDDDKLMVVEVTGSPLFPEAEGSATPLLSWTRDDGETYHEGGIVGWQLVNSEGVNVHGGLLDPFELQSFEVLVGDAADTARAGAIAGGYSVHPVRDGDIEGPSFVESLSKPSLKP